MGRGRQSKGLFERPGVAVVGGGVGGFFEVAGGHRRLVAVEGDAAQHDQSPRCELVVELIPNHQAPGEQRLRLVCLALRPERCAERDVDP
jgi:hypothetical protein